MQSLSDLQLTSILADLLDIYQRFFPSFFSSGIPQESLSTCSNCAMVCRDPSKDTEKLGIRTFHADKKCCTYYPSIPNFLVGGILVEASSEAKKRIRESIIKGVAVTPYGLMTPKYYHVLYSNQIGGFGNSEALLCPYYVKETGYCSVWKYRESVCSTYFCKTLAGDAGRNFWMSLKKYLAHIEHSLAQYLILEAGLDHVLTANSEDSSKLTPEDLDGLKHKNYEEIWGDFIGREEEFYILAFQMVNKLSRKKFEQVTGIREQVLLKRLVSEYDKMLKLPDNLEVHTDWKPKEGEFTKSVQLKSIDIQFDLPSDILNAFDGKSSVSTIKARLSEQNGFEVEDSLILSLYNYGVLKKAE